MSDFLLGQQLRELTETEPDLVRALVWRTESLPNVDPKEHWRAIDRDAVIDRAASAAPGSRFGLVCDAGLGKTFNMRWLFDRLCDWKYRPRVPFLLRLDKARDLRVVVDACSDPDVLLERLTDLVHHRSSTTSRDRLRTALIRKRARGEISLHFDGLDHALAEDFFPSIFAELLATEHWKHCPVWVAGRPYAFNKAWGEVFGSTLKNWKFFQVDRFGEREIRQYMRLRAGGDWYGDLPAGSRGLLGIPRLLALICDIIRKNIAGAPVGTSPADVVMGLRLNTPADVYHTAYFEKGKNGEPETQGLIAQGLKDVAACIGFDEGYPVNYGNLSKRIERVGTLLGATAFHMFDQNTYAPTPEPNTSGADLDAIRAALITRLSNAGQGGEREYDRDHPRLRNMNTNHLEFLLLAESTEERVRFPDRTVQAFFAAHWAMKYGSPTDRKNLTKWITDNQGEALSGFDEFWQFAAELPEQLIDPDKKPETNRWHRTFAPCYAPPQTIAGPHEWVQWHRKMIYHTLAAMEKRFPATVRSWREPFTRLGAPADSGTANPWRRVIGWLQRALLGDFAGRRARIHREITGGFRRIPAGNCHFGADPLDDPPQTGVTIPVAEFRLHQYPVTNEMYELFDPAHKDNRWDGNPHPLAKATRGGDDWCPVVNATFYDAWNFAAWCGCQLPTEEQWEHACRAGTAFAYSFGNDEEALPDHAWFVSNSKSMTHPVGERPIAGKEHPHRLYDMHGNVWEWCASWYTNEQDSRVRRGGSWYSYAWYCRTAYRYRGRAVVPDPRLRFSALPPWTGITVHFFTITLFPVFCFSILLPSEARRKKFENSYVDRRNRIAEPLEIGA